MIRANLTVQSDESGRTAAVRPAVAGHDAPAAVVADEAVARVEGLVAEFALETWTGPIEIPSVIDCRPFLGFLDWLASSLSATNQRRPWIGMPICFPVL